MSWDGIYAKDRYYPQFEVGDEVFTTKRSWRAISANKPYRVVNCHKKPGMTIDIWLVTLVTDGGYENDYASYQFQKTERQILMEQREDKLKMILC
jgi:hypothetical protein